MNELAAQLGKLSLGLAILFVVYLIIKALPTLITAIRKNGNGSKKANSSGEKSPEWWAAEMERIVAKVLEAKWAARNEDFRKIVNEALDRMRKDN